MVFRRGGQMRFGGEGLELLAGQLGIGHGEESSSIFASALKSR